MEKHRKRLIIDHPYVGAIVTALVLFRGIPKLGRLIGGAAATSFNLDAMQALVTSVIAVSMVILLAYRLWLRREPFNGTLPITGGGTKEACRLAVMVYAVDLIGIMTVIAVDYDGIGNLVPPGVATLLMALCAGTYEEVAFRAIPLSILMKNRPDTKRIITAVILTSVIFGGAHMTNIGAGENVTIAMYQSFQAMVIGTFFTALYLRSGSIVLPMVFHFVHDMTASMIPAQSTGPMMQQSITMGTFIPDMVIMTAEVIATIYLLRSSKMDEIKETWRDKWSEDELHD